MFTRRLPNDRALAVRYLLLRYLALCKGLVPRTALLEIAQTLTVASDDTGDHYFIRWKRGGEKNFVSYPGTRFRLFAAADGAISPGSSKGPNPNSTTAREFVLAAVGLDVDSIGVRLSGFHTCMVGRLIGMALCCAGMVFWGGPTALPVAMMILLMYSTDFWYPWSRFALPVFVGILGILGMEMAAVVSSSALIVLHSLDQYKTYRFVRLISLLLVVFYGTAMLVSGNAPLVGAGKFMLLMIAGSGIALYRSLCGSHFRFCPLVNPLLFAGLYADGYGIPSIVGLGYSLVSALSVMHGHTLRPIARNMPLP